MACEHKTTCQKKPQLKITQRIIENFHLIPMEAAVFILLRYIFDCDWKEKMHSSKTEKHKLVSHR